MGFETFVARRYLKSKRKEVFISIITVISVLGVAISVLVLDMVLAIMTGFEIELQSKFVDANSHLTFKRIGGEISDYESIVEQIRKQPDVLSAEPFTFSQAFLTTPQGSRGLLIRGEPGTAAFRDRLAKMKATPLQVDRLFKPPPVEVKRPDGTTDMIELPALIIGKALSDRLGIYPGDVVNVFSPQFGSSPKGLIPKLRRFQIVGIYNSGLTEYEAGLAYASIDATQAFFELGTRVTGIEATVTDMYKARAIGDKILGQISSEDPLYFSDWTEPNKPLWEAIKLERRVYFIVLLLLILIASFSIVSTLVMVVMEKSRDIAILKCLGATDSSILRIFIFQGSIIGTTGIILGSILGYLGCVILRKVGFPLDVSVFSLEQVPVHLDPWAFVTVAVAAFFITLLAGVYPAFRAARLKTADALRYE
jgi:lipoprotein-releasing system permease protein